MSDQVLTTEPAEIGRWEPDAQDYFMLRELIHQARAEALEAEATPENQYFTARYIATLLGRILDASDFRPARIQIGGDTP